MMTISMIQSCLMGTVWIFLVLKSVDGQCTFPTNLRGEWISSKKGSNVTFTSSQIDGYHPCKKDTFCTPDIPSQWECFDSRGNAFALRTNEFSDGGFGRVYTCLYFIEISSTEYLSYQGPDAHSGPPYNDYVKSSLSSSELSFNDVCDLDLNTVSIARHSIFIKKDSITSTTSTCPSELLGNYQTDNTVSCNTTVDVCENRKEITVGNTTCDPLLFYSESGKLSCLYSLADGETTYITLYNQDDTVDNTNTYRFTCLTLTENGNQILIRQNALTCDDLTTHATADFTMNVNFLCPLTCTFASSLEGNWTSNRKGEISISADTITGFEPYGSDCTVCNSQPDQFECYLQSGTKYLIRTARTYINNKSVRIYACLDFSFVSSIKYVYYQAHSSKDEDLGDYLTTLNAALPVDSIEEVCSESAPYDAALHSVLIKSGSLEAAATTCPGDFDGIYNNTGNACDVTFSTCDNNDEIKLSNTGCNNLPFYTAGGTVSCVYHTSDQSYTYLTLLNNDVSPDDTFTFRFTCIVFIKSGSTLQFTQTHGGCHSGQTATYVNTTRGSGFEYEYIDECPTDDFDWIIIVIVIVVIIAAIILFLIIYFWCGCKCLRRRKAKQDEENIIENNVIDKKSTENPNVEKTRQATIETGHAVGVEAGVKSRLRSFFDYFTPAEKKTVQIHQRKQSRLYHRREQGKGLDSLGEESGGGHEDSSTRGGKKTERGRRRRRRRGVQVLPYVTKSGEVSTDEFYDDQKEDSSSVTYSDDFTSDEDSEYDSSDDNSHNHRKTLHGSSNKRRFDLAWGFRENNLELVQDEVQPHTRGEYEERDQEKMYKDLPPDSSNMSKISRRRDRKFFPFNNGKQRDDQKLPIGRTSDFREIPFMAEYCKFKNQRRSLDDEGFWDETDGHFKSADEQFGFNELDEKLRLEYSKSSQRGNSDADIAQEAEAAGMKSRLRSEKRVLIGSHTTFPSGDEGDTGIDTQSNSSGSQNGARIKIGRNEGQIEPN